MVSKGVPWEVATNLPDEERLAYAVALAEMESAKHRFDWENLEWVDTVEEEKVRKAEALEAEAEEIEALGARHDVTKNRLGWA